jgi:hypothetical protein
MRIHDESIEYVVDGWPPSSYVLEKLVGWFLARTMQVAGLELLES